MFSSTAFLFHRDNMQGGGVTGDQQFESKPDQQDGSW